MTAGLVYEIERRIGCVRAFRPRGNRSAGECLARDAAVIVLRETGLGWSATGRLLGRTHNAVLYAWRRARRRMEDGDERFCGMVEKARGVHELARPENQGTGMNAEPVYVASGRTELGAVGFDAIGGYFVGNGAMYWLLLGRNSEKSSNHHRIERIYLDGPFPQGGLILAAAECCVVEQLVATNYAGPCVVLCNQFGASFLSTMQQNGFSNCQLAVAGDANCGPLMIVKNGKAVVSNIRYAGGGFSIRSPLARAVVEIHFQGEPGQCDCIEFLGVRSEGYSAEAFVRVWGDGPQWINRTGINRLRIVGGTIETGRYVIDAPGVFLADCELDALVRRPVGVSGPLIRCSGFANLRINGHLATADDVQLDAEPLKPGLERPTHGGIQPARPLPASGGK